MEHYLVKYEEMFGDMSTYKRGVFITTEEELEKAKKMIEEEIKSNGSVTSYSSGDTYYEEYYSSLDEVMANYAIIPITDEEAELLIKLGLKRFGDYGLLGGV